MYRTLVPLDVAPPRLPPPTAQRLDLDGHTMGTTWSVKLYAAPAISPDALRRGIQARLDEVVAQMSTWEADSALSLYNTAAPGWQVMPQACFDVIAAAMAVAKQSTGAYDPTVGPLVNLWGFGPGGRHAKPSEKDIAAARARCGWWRVALDAARRAVSQPGESYIDLSAIAKGYGVDAVAAYLRQNGCDSFLVEVGGELLGEGVKPDGQPWWVELERPGGRAHEPLIVALHGLAVASSGDYRRCWFDASGKRYSHTIDPRTGIPVLHDTAAVSVLHKRCMLADALSTALMVMGTAEGMQFAQRHDIAALFIDRDGDRYVESLSPALAAMLD